MQRGPHHVVSERLARDFTCASQNVFYTGMKSLNVKFQIIKKKVDLLGESPTWNARNSRIYWVDILKRQFHYINIDNAEFKTFPALGMISSIVTTNKDTMAATEGHSLYLIDENGTHLEISKVEQKINQTRFNDGKVDPFGRFVAGTMDIKEKYPIGSLYVFTSRKVKKILDNITVSNGMAWDLKNNIFYHIDTPTREIKKYTFNEEMDIELLGTAIDFRKEKGYPDGMTIDSTGNLWIAHWGGGEISIWEPEKGIKIDEIKFPAQNITSCVFGGESLSDLFVTSASNESNSDLGGSLFCVKTEYEGTKTSSFII